MNHTIKGNNVNISKVPGQDQKEKRKNELKKKKRYNG